MMKGLYKSGEKTAMEAIDKLYNIHNIKYEPNGSTSFPDFSFGYERDLKLLEVTISGGGVLVGEDYSLKPSMEINLPISHFAKCLNKLVKVWINPSDTIILNFTKEMKTSKKTLLEIDRKLKTYYQYKDKEALDFLVNKYGIEVEKITNYYAGLTSYSPIKSIISVGLETPHPLMQNNLTFQASSILFACLTKKIEKFKKVDDGRRTFWIAIVNYHPLLNITLYSDAIDNVVKVISDFCFEKVFIVQDAKAYEIWSLN